MEKIKILFVQEKKVKKKDLTLGAIMETVVPDTYEADYVSIKEDVLKKIDQFQPQIISVSQSKSFDILQMVMKIKELFPETVIFSLLSDGANNEQELEKSLKEAGVYKCYSTTFSIDAFVHDTFVALNME